MKKPPSSRVRGRTVYWIAAVCARVPRHPGAAGTFRKGNGELRCTGPSPDNGPGGGIRPGAW
ncbi:MAG: hypothetical protein ACLGQW_08290, partial [Acidobacteriota bacterium]